MKLSILCDLDEICADLFKKWLGMYNAEHNDTLDKNELTWNGMAARAKNGKEIYSYLHKPGFFADLEPIPGAIDALKEFLADGHEVTILSAPSYPGPSSQDKQDWVQKHMPFIHYRDVMLGWKKDKVQGDLLIDDSPENIKSYRKRWGDKAKIFTIAYNHNAEVKHLTDIYALDCNKTEDAWKIIRAGVKELATRTSYDR